ncbi:MAG: helix-turn-helix domain-containing protein [Candidatus Omnitrophica bacterium]|nr:helix-turn-helix domain-containing protein [Candidatus Omnitrophota bacterium]
MPTIGEQLRAAREAQGLAIDDAHRHTKIHAKILHAMEEDRTDDVLEPAYARGFLKKYATFLNLDPEPLVQEYLRSPTTTTTASPLAGGRSGGPASHGDPLRPPEAEAAPARWVGPAAVAVTAALGLTFLGVLVRDLYQTVSAPSATVRAPAAAKASGTGYKPVPGTGIATPAPKPLVPKSQPLKLSIRAAQDCWMQVKADGKVLFQNVLKKGSEEIWTASDDLELWVGNAAALSLTLNGRALDPLGGGVQKGVRVTRSGIQRPKASS